MNAGLFLAAAELCAAGDQLRLLRQCAFATGKPWVQRTDLERVGDASAAWTIARASTSGTMTPADTLELLRAVRRKRGRG